MESYIVEWLSLLVRWAHFIVGVAWIGASFYFIWLDNHLQPPKSPADVERGVGGELWAVHGGGFYQAQKYKVAPERLPETLHWFKWEAYTTFISGFFLLCIVYYYGASTHLIDPQIADLSPMAAIILGISAIVMGWVGCSAWKPTQWRCTSAAMAAKSTGCAGAGAGMGRSAQATMVIATTPARAGTGEVRPPRSWARWRATNQARIAAPAPHRAINTSPLCAAP